MYSHLPLSHLANTIFSHSIYKHLQCNAHSLLIRNDEPFHLICIHEFDSMHAYLNIMINLIFMLILLEFLSFIFSIFHIRNVSVG